MIDRDDPYERRRRPRAYKNPPLREPSPDQRPVSRHSSGRRVPGDTSGWVHDGAGSPYSDAHVPTGKRR